MSFTEVFRATAHSHLYLGGEVAVLLGAITSTGTFDNVSQFFFFFLPSWLFCASLLLAPLHFNPFAFQLGALREDRTAFARWLVAERGGSDDCWRTWHAAAGEGAYAQASLAARAWRVLRASRLLLLAALLASRVAAPPLALLLFAAAPFATMTGLQLVAVAAPHLPRRDAGARRTRGCPFLQPLAAALRAAVCGGVLFAVLVVMPSLGFFRLEGAGGAAWVVLVQVVLHAWACRVAVIANGRPLRSGAAALWQLLDAALGGCLLLLMSILSLLPLASTLHARAMFPLRYAHVVALTSGNKEALERYGGGGPAPGRKGGGALEPLEFATPGVHRGGSDSGSSAGGGGGGGKAPRAPGPIAQLSGGGGGIGGGGGGGGGELRPHNHARDRQFRLRRALQAAEGGAPPPLSQQPQPAAAASDASLLRGAGRLGGVAEGASEAPLAHGKRLEEVLSAARVAAAARVRAEGASASAATSAPATASSRGRGGGGGDAKGAHDAAGGSGGSAKAPVSAFAAARCMFEKKE